MDPAFLPNVNKVSFEFYVLIPIPMISEILPSLSLGNRYVRYFGSKNLVIIHQAIFLKEVRLLMYSETCLKRSPAILPKNGR